MKFNNTNSMYVIAGLSMLFGACANNDHKLLDSQETLDKNRAVWSELSFQDYRYNFRRSCFCLPDFVREVIIHSSNGQVASALFANDLTSANISDYPAIEDMFDSIQEAINSDTSVVIEYHPQFGYPTLISRDPLPQAVDDEIVFHVDHFKVNGTLHTAAILTANLNTTLKSADYQVREAMIKSAAASELSYDTLNLTLDTPSSCGNSYFKFFISKALMESFPPQAQSKLLRLPVADDTCDMPQTYQVSIDLSTFKQELINGGYSEVLLHIDALTLTYKF